MAYISAEIKLPEVERMMTVQLYFPTDLPAEVGNKVKGVITLLHGMGNIGKDWMMMTAATRYAADNGYILVAPDADNSFYHDMYYGAPFYTALTQLLPAQLEKIFHIPSARACNYIAGLSMGGYGALRLGLSLPRRYAAIGAFSGAVDVAWLAQQMRAAGPEAATHPMMKMLDAVLGEAHEVPREADLFRLVEDVAALPKAQQPRILCTCGKQDEMAGVPLQNRNFAAHAKALSLADFHLQEWDGVHEWNFWDRSLAAFIGFVQNSDYGARKQADWAAPEMEV